MLKRERKNIIEYIKANDHTYDYNAVNFNYYSDEELYELKKKLVRKNIEVKKLRRQREAVRPVHADPYKSPVNVFK
jgi:hypothetical protein